MQERELLTPSTWYESMGHDEERGEEGGESCDGLLHHGHDVQIKRSTIGSSIVVVVVCAGGKEDSDDIGRTMRTQR